MSQDAIRHERVGAALFERWFNQLRYRVWNPQFVISIALLAVLAYLIVVPLFDMIRWTFVWGEGSARISPDADPGAFTLFYWKYMLFGRAARSAFYEPLFNTLLTGSVAAVLALALGGSLAWLVTRTDMPGGGTLKSLLTLPYIIPSFAIALAWEILFKSPAVGGQPGIFESVFGVAPPLWLSYGPVPIILTMSIHYYPFAYLLVAGGLATLDSQLEESAELLGASRWMLLRKITFPIVAPAFVSAFVLTLGKTIGTFALPFLLGGPVRYFTISTLLFANIGMGLTGMGYVLALVLIFISALSIYLSNRVVGKNLRRFETIGGKGFKGTPTSLGKWRWPLTCVVGLVAVVTALFPLGLLGYQTLMLVDGRYGLDNLTLHYWFGLSDPELAEGEPGLIHNPVILGGAWNSLRLAILASFICAILGLVIAYIVVRGRKSWVANLLDQISFLPFLMPSIAFGAMYLSLFATARGPIPALYGTFTLLVLISVVKRLPYSTRTGTSAVTQISLELEEAALIQGASWFYRFRRIVFPLATSGAVAGVMVSFIGIMRELSLIILLITPSTRVLMTVGFRYVEEDQVQLANALVFLVAMITIAGELLVWWLGKSRLARVQQRAIE